MGSIGARTARRGWLYRASKAAVNSVLKDVSLALEGRAVCVALHPGWVRTGMGGSGADLDVAHGVASLRQTLSRLAAADNGRYLDHDGTPIPWWRGRKGNKGRPMLLTEDHRAVQDAVRTYVQERIAPQAALWHRTHHFPRDELRGLAGLGCYGVAVPQELGGAGLDYLCLSLILEEIAAGDGATSTIVSVNNCPVCSILLAYGNGAQQAQWLQPLARGDLLGAFCLTEPHVGSEAGGLKTTARRDGDQYVLDGVKQFITSGRNGDVAIVLAVTDKAAGKKGISAFIVPTRTPGYSVARLEDKMGQHASDTAQVLFENCRIPAANRLGDEGQGLKIALSGLEGGRIGIASQAVGMARAAFEAALSYAKDRQAFGKPIFEHQALQFKLADMATQIEAARQLIHHAASLKDAGRPCLKEAAMAKLFASEMAERVCSAAIQVHGGYGYVSDFPVERIYRDVRVCQIYEGTSEVQRILIGRALAA
jgi:butyryl-CoA dehydrogenase